METEIPEWRIPPKKEIIHRKLKAGPKKRICRTRKQKEHNKCNDTKEVSSFHEPSEVDLSCAVFPGRTSLSTISSKDSSTESHKDRVRDVYKQLKQHPNASTTSNSHNSCMTHVEALSVPAQKRSRSARRRQSEQLILDRYLLVAEERPISSKVNLSHFRPESPGYPGLLAERPQSCQSSMSSSSMSSTKQESINETKQKDKPQLDNPPQKSINAKEEANEGYDTDLELEITSEFRELELKEKLMQQDADIGHITYENVCRANGVVARTQIKRQLWQKRLDLSYAGLQTVEVKAVVMALAKNNRIEDIDMSHNSLTDQAITFLVNFLVNNTYVTKLSLAGSTLELNGAMAACTLLSRNEYLVYLNFSECSIGDTEVGYLAQGLQVNHILQQVNLSKNRIGLVGSLQLARAFAENVTLVSVDLSWNHIRGGGAVAIGNSLKKNKKLEELDISWNGLGLEGSIAFGETLRVNKMIKRINMENNRITLDGAMYLAKGIAVNIALEVLQIGLNPLSIPGCEEILKAMAKPTSRIKHLSLREVPISTKIALKASDIAKTRDFTLQHGGILNTKDVTGIQRPRREDPLSLLIRYLSIMGIRVMDLFRMFDKDTNLFVSKEKFIQGLKRVRVPLDDADLLVVAKRLRSNKRGEISYQELASTVRNRIFDRREEYRRQERILMKKRNEKIRVLNLDKDLHDAGFLPEIPGLYGLEHSDQSSKKNPKKGKLSRRESGVTTLPPIKSGRNIDLVEMGDHRSGISYISQIKRQHISNKLTARQRFL